MPAYDKTVIQHHLAVADAGQSHAAKGRAFEDLVCYLFGLVPGLISPIRNKRNAFETEEIDVAFYNDQESQGLRGFNQILLIECKNWSTAVGSMEVSWFITKIRDRGLDFGILIAANGITGDAHDKVAAHHVVSMALAANVRLIIMTRAEIEGLNTSEELVRLIKEKVCQLVVTGTVWP